MQTYRSLRARAQRGQALFLYGPLPTTSPKPTGDWPLSGPTTNGQLLILYYDSDRRAFRVYNNDKGITWGQLGRAWVSATDMSTLIDRRKQDVRVHLALPQETE